MRKSRRDFKQEARRTPYEVELDASNEDGTPMVVTFLDPNKLATRTAFELARSSDPEEQMRLLLSPDDFPPFWAEWGDAPVDETNALLGDVLKYYGADPGKLSR